MSDLLPYIFGRESDLRRVNSRILIQYSNVYLFCILYKFVYVCASLFLCELSVRLGVSGFVFVLTMCKFIA